MSLNVGIDSFVNLSDASAYFANRLYSATWSGATDADREKALKMSTGILCRERWQGTLTSSTQLLAWPRQGVVDAEGRAIPSTTIPQTIKDVTAELALNLLTEDQTADDGSRNVRAVTAGSVKVEYAGAAPVRRLPDFVAAIVAPLLTSPGGTSQNSVQMVF